MSPGTLEESFEIPSRVASGFGPASVNQALSENDEYDLQEACCSLAWKSAPWGCECVLS